MSEHQGLSKTGNGPRGRKNSINAAAIALRRLRVAHFLTRHYTEREIQDALILEELVNPETGVSYSLGTIHADCVQLRTEWRQAAAKDIADHKARMLAELQAVKRQGWAKDDMPVVLKALSQEADLLGTDAPKQIAGSQTGEIVFRVVYDDDDPDAKG